MSEYQLKRGTGGPTCNHFMEPSNVQDISKYVAWNSDNAGVNYSCTLLTAAQI